MDHLEPIHGLANDHHQDLLRLAQQEKRAWEHQAPQRLHHRALAWLGDRLITWGQSLRERYSPPAPALPHQPCPRAQQIIDILL